MAPYRTSFFNDHIRQAQIELERRNGYVSPVVRQISTDTALAHLGHALRIANQLGDDVRKATCMRVLNWVRADLRKAA
jgi:hypothetical protein